MNDIEAKRFEQEQMPWYSKYKGISIGSAALQDADYLILLAKGDEFRNQLLRFINSEHFKRRYGSA